MHYSRLNAIINSSLWSAYGDALGFISELVDTNGLKRRINDQKINKSMPWKRKVGGKFGAEVNLPAGCYSDDTQLRLATSRAIRADGSFDVEVFTKVELPVWLSYALGAGRGTKAAARSLIQKDVTWYSNFFNEKSVDYLMCGGNGAAMRIQPHVWVAKDLDYYGPYVLDVIRNSVSTHGHPRAILGAVFHALCLAFVLQNNELPDPKEWENIISVFNYLPRFIKKDEELGTFWLPVWERRAGTTIDDAFMKVTNESLHDLHIIREVLYGDRKDAYRQLVHSVGALNPSERGSGTKTSFLAAALSWMHKHDNTPEGAIISAVNVLGSDTDTIATMTGALLGALSKKAPDDNLLDKEYIEAEAARIYDIHLNKSTRNINYPNLFEWSPPRSQQDAVGRINNKLALKGLGYVDILEDPYESPNKNDAVWQWVKLQFGQSIVVKRRSNPRSIDSKEFPAEQNTLTDLISSQNNTISSNSINQFSHVESKNKMHRTEKSLDELTNEAIYSGFDENLIGRHIIILSEQNNGIEKAGIYAGIIAKARIARIRSKKSRKE